MEKTIKATSTSGKTVLLDLNRFMAVIAQCDKQFAKYYDSGKKRDGLSFLQLYLRRKALEKAFDIKLEGR